MVFSGDFSHYWKSEHWLDSPIMKTEQLSVIGKFFNLKLVPLELPEEDNCHYQQKLVTSCDTTVIVRHLNGLKKTVVLAKLFSLDEVTVSSSQQKVDLKISGRCFLEVWKLGSQRYSGPHPQNCWYQLRKVKSNPMISRCYKIRDPRTSGPFLNRAC